MVDTRHWFISHTWLLNNEINWQRDKMSNFNGATILLSHHQLFSANTAINGMESVMKVVPYFNPYLYRVFWDFMTTKVAGWIWGHEHNFVMYQNEMLDLAKGRLVGNSAYEELTASDPYKINYPQIPYLISEPGYDKYKLGTNSDSNGVAYYNHGYAILDFGGRKTPTDKINASYFQFPAWGDQPPAKLSSTLIFSEPFSLPQSPFGTGNRIHSGKLYILSNQDGMSVQKAYHGSFNYNYPILNPSTMPENQAITLKIVNNTDGSNWPDLQDGNLLNISSLEPNLGTSQTITVGKTPWLYYDLWHNPGFEIQQWIIHKRDKGIDPYIYVGEPFYLESVAYPGQFLKPVYAKKWALIYLTTEAGMDFCWKFGQIG